jgi:hypothetical protein
MAALAPPAAVAAARGGHEYGALTLTLGPNATVGAAQTASTASTVAADVVVAAVVADLKQRMVSALGRRTAVHADVQEYVL